MILMQNQKLQSSGHSATNKGQSCDSSYNQHQINWASVASWFFRPDCPFSSSSTLTSTCNSSSTTTSGTINSQYPVNFSHQHQQQKKQLQHHQQQPPQQPSQHIQPGKEEHKPYKITHTPTICTAIRCTVLNCSCDCFTPGQKHLRYCETCKHGWVPHALDKLGSRHLFINSIPEPVRPNAAFDIASLVLYGCQALPIRLKILLDRLFSALHKDQVIQVLHGFGWTQEDYARGYILQDARGGATLDKWSICSPEEEPLVLQQFLRFGETRSITQQLLAAQQALQESQMLDHLEQKPQPSQTPQHLGRRPVSPKSRSSSSQAFNPSLFTSELQNMSPHQRNSLNFMKLPPSNGSISSTSLPGIGTTTPGLSPLNRLQNMQPFDFRKLSAGLTGFHIASQAAAAHRHHGLPDLHAPRSSSRRSAPSDIDPTTTGLNLSLSGLPSPLPMCLPPPPPVSISASSLNPSAVAMAAAVSANSLAAAVSANSLAAVVSANSFAAASLVASSFPSMISTGSKSPSTADFLSGGGSSDFGSEDDDEQDEDNSNSALNLSRDKDSNKSLRQPRSSSSHLKKPVIPPKRHWGPSLPLNLGTQFINPATGKKRVQCNVCLKTFCDKGALKIHFSAVHLREMHKCTVEGCNMMFSSRRSRNRHSANPNPKLHSPHLRRKISPHDGRSAQAHQLLIPPPTGLSLSSALNPLNPFGSFPLLTPPRHHSASLTPMDFKQSIDLSMQKFDENHKEYRDRNSMEERALALTTSDSQHADEEDDDDDGIVVVGGDDEDEGDRNEHIYTEPETNQPENYSMTAKRSKMSSSDLDEDIVSNIDSNEDSLSVVDTHSLKDETSFPTNKRKRKSQNPTRCTLQPMMEDIITDGESSNDASFPTEMLHREEPVKHEKQEESAKDIKEEISEIVSVKQEVIIKNEEMEEQDAPLDLGMNSERSLRASRASRSPDVNANETETDIEIKTSLTPVFSKDKLKKESFTETTDHSESLRSESNDAPNEHERDENRPPSSTGSHKTDESIESSNALKHLESLSHNHFSDLMSHGLLGHPQQGQFSTLGFMMGTDPPSPAHSHASSAGSSNGLDSPDDNSQNQVFGHFDNGHFISTMDVPIDKENPRRCTACGKIFQNHFGVKTHYQNVHLKLMHKCNVDGCNAAFPSKRSRDRHSANLNLHRKLLSTSSSSDKSGSSFFMDKSPFASLASSSSLHNEFLARLYTDSQGLPLNLETHKNHSLPTPTSNIEQMLLNGDRLPPPPLLLPPLNFSLGHFSHLSPVNGSSSVRRKSRLLVPDSSTVSTSPPSLNSSPPPFPYSIDEETPTADSDGKLSCQVCQTTIQDSTLLKDHYEKNHLSDLYRCTIPGCTKLFTSKSKRNYHVDHSHIQSSGPSPSSTQKRITETSSS